jgi:hypothetical protein
VTLEEPLQLVGSFRALETVDGVLSKCRNGVVTWCKECKRAAASSEHSGEAAELCEAHEL